MNYSSDLSECRHHVLATAYKIATEQKKNTN